MKFEGAVIKEQAVTFTVVIVKRHIIQNKAEADMAIGLFQPVFPGLPIVLMTQDHQGVPTYYGRSDLSNYLAKVSLEAIPWERFSI